MDQYTLTDAAPPSACNTPHHCSASVSPTASIEESLCTRWTPPDSTAGLHFPLDHHGALLSAAGTDLHGEDCKDSSRSPTTSSVQWDTVQLEEPRLPRRIYNHFVTAQAIDLCSGCSTNNDTCIQRASCSHQFSPTRRVSSEVVYFRMRCTTSLGASLESTASMCSAKCSTWIVGHVTIQQNGCYPLQQVPQTIINAQT